MRARRRRSRWPLLRSQVLGANNTSMGMERETERRRRDFNGFCLDAARMALAKPDCIVQHPLPAHRGEEITPDVFETHADEIFDEAENRLHVEKAVLGILLAGK